MSNTIQKMNICIVSPIDERVPPTHYGGIGRIVASLVSGLVEKGHRVTLIAPGDSTVKAELIPIIPKALLPDNIYNRNPKLREAYLNLVTAKIVDVLSTKRFSLVNNHFGWRLIPFGKFINSPLITTLHTPMNQENKKLIFSTYKKTPIISTSNNQREPMPQLNYVGNIYNGINVSSFKFYPANKGYLVFLGRMSPEKGPLEAIQIAKALKVKLIMAGAIHGWDKPYFESQIKKHIDKKKVIFIGEVNDLQKNKLLGEAIALLAPIQWREPFGLMFIESMACGTPVITFNRGSAKEIVVNKSTGIIAGSASEVISRFGEIEGINRMYCREYIEKKFTAQIMVNEYEKLFMNFLKRKNKIC